MQQQDTSRVRTATIGHFTRQVVQGLWGGGRAGSAWAVEGVGVGMEEMERPRGVKTHTPLPQLPLC